MPVKLRWKKLWGLLPILVLPGLLLLLPGSSGQLVLAEVGRTKPTDLRHPTETFSADSSARTVVDAFRQAGFAYYPEDLVSAFPDPSLGLGTVVVVKRALPVVIKDRQKEYEVRTWQTTVGSLLEEKRVTLGDDDRVNPGLGASLARGVTIVITRVARSETSQFETVPYETVEQPDNSLYRGERRVTQSGRSGRREKKFLQVREDGVLVSTTLLSNRLIEPPQPRIVRVGTKLRIGQVFTGKATWYLCCGTRVAIDKVRTGAEVRITNLENGKQIIVRSDGCICGNRPELVVDLHPDLFKQLGGTLSRGVLAAVKVEEIIN